MSEAAHLVFIFMASYKRLCRPKLKSQFQINADQFKWNGVYNCMQIKLLMPRELCKHSTSTSQQLCQGDKDKSSSFSEIKERKTESLLPRVTVGESRS